MVLDSSLTSHLAFMYYTFVSKASFVVMNLEQYIGHFRGGALTTARNAPFILCSVLVYVLNNLYGEQQVDF